MKMETYRCTPEELLRNSRLPTRVMTDEAAMMEEIAELMYREILEKPRNGRTVLICPVGPVAQYPLLARKLNESNTSLNHVWFINMDEYLDDRGRNTRDKNLSFHHAMERHFFGLLRPQLLPPPSQRIFPDPGDPQAVDRLLESLGGADLTLTGVGINGHLAFNEPPEPDQSCTDREFACLPSRVLPIAVATVVNNGGRKLGGALELFPRQCVTLGMKSLLASRKIKIYLYCDWQWGVMRRLSLEEPSRLCPASLLQNHPNAEMVVSQALLDYQLPHLPE